MMGLGVRFHEAVSPLMERVAPYMPGETFPFFFTVEMFQRPARSFIITLGAGVPGPSC